MKARRIPLAVAAVLVLAGCGSDKPSVSTGGSAPSQEAKSGAPSESAPSQSSSRVSGEDSDEPQKPKEHQGSDENSALGASFGGKKVDPEGFKSTDVFADGGYYFQTQSGKHQCVITVEFVGCVHMAAPANAPKVQQADGGYGPANASRMYAGKKAEMFGVSDTTFLKQDGQAKVLGYGEVLDVKGFQCTTDMELGVVCKQGEHGLQVSSQKYTLR